MKPYDDNINGHESGSSGTRSDDSESDESAALEEELSLVDEGAPARALAALNALRKARQHYDVILTGGAPGEDVAAHRAVLAAASPRLLAALPPADASPGPGAAPVLRLPEVEAEALRELVEYAYTGRLRVRDAVCARRLYRAAACLRMEAARAHLAEQLVRRATPQDVLAVRALPDLRRHHRAALDAYITQHFDEICACGALAPLPLVLIEMLRETSAERGEEPPAAVAHAALAWLRAQLATGSLLEELCSRTHLLFVDAGGALRDCGELPASCGDAPELHEYRREAAERERGARRRAGERERTERAEPPSDERGEEERDAGDTGVLVARVAPGAGVTRALLVLRGKLAAARIAWRAGSGSGAAQGGRLGGAAEPEDAPRLAPMSVPRCALGAAPMGGRLLVCGGYDRARVLLSAEAYDPDTNTWSPLPDMRRARARFPMAVLGDVVYALGGSDGHAELETVDALVDGAWVARARLPLACSHAAAAADEQSGVLYVAGGWAAGRSLRQVHCYSPKKNSWTEAPSLITGRSQCAGVVWEGAAWVLGGCDAWHCLASTERLGAGGWAQGPPLPTARRSVGGAVWRGRLLAAGGSSGGASLQRTAWLASDASAWREGPPLREARAAPALCVLRDVLYAAGGFSGQEFLASVECLYEPDGCWTSLWVAPAIAVAPFSNANVDDVHGAELNGEKEPEEPSAEEGRASARGGECDQQETAGEGSQCVSQRDCTHDVARAREASGALPAAQ